MTRSTLTPRPHRGLVVPGMAALALLAVLAVLALVGPAAADAPTPPTGDRLAAAVVDHNAVPSPSDDGYQQLAVGHRSRSVPAAILAVAVAIGGWTLGRRFVPPPAASPVPEPRRPAWGNRGPPPLSV